MLIYLPYMDLLPSMMWPEMMYTDDNIDTFLLHSLPEVKSADKNRSIGPELTTAKTGPIHLSSLVEIAFVD